MAKLKTAPGRLIGRWKQEAIAAHAGASDEDLAKIINDRAKAEGYRYTITPEKVREKTKKRKRRRGRVKSTSPEAPAAGATPAPKAPARGGISLDDVRALKGLVDRMGADKVQELAGVLSK
jgi:hypothetical protein